MRTSEADHRRPADGFGEQRAEEHPPASPDSVSAIWISPENNLNVLDTFRHYCLTLRGLPAECELIVVINGDRGSPRALVEQLRSDDVAVRLVHIHRYCDQATAMRAGLASSRGARVVFLPDYIESDETAIHDMLAELDRGAHYVASWRQQRVDSGWSALNSRIFNRLTRLMTNVPLHDINSGLRAMTREVTEKLPVYGDLHQFLPILAAMQGFVVSEVKVRHICPPTPRSSVAVRLHPGVYLRRLLDLLTLFFLFKFTKKPLRFFGLIGSAALALGGGVVLVLVVQRMLGTGLADRPLLLLGITGIVLGVQLFSLGLLGELIIFTHGRHLFQQHSEELAPPAGDDGKV